MIEIRPARLQEAEEFMQVMGSAFGFEPPEQSGPFRQYWEPERSRCAYQDGKMVGTSGAYSFQMTVPGTVIPSAGTTMVSVLPSHRRQGVLTQMMQAHLQEAKEREESFASLWASDSAIYGRFGYGEASRDTETTIDRQFVKLHKNAPEPDPVRMVTQEEASTNFPLVYEQMFSHRPGCFARSQTWWNLHRFRDLPDHRDGATKFRFAVSRGPNNQPSGYVQYRVKSDWEQGHATGKVIVNELVSNTPEAASGLWKFVLEHDLISQIVAENRPVDDLLPDLLSGTRRAQRLVLDALWVRLLNIPQAFSLRRYRHPGQLVFEVIDPMGMDSGSYRLEVAEDGTGNCEPTTAEPDLSMNIAELGGAYLGWSRMAHLRRAGRVTGTEPAARQADHMLGWDPLPWCPEIF